MKIISKLLFALAIVSPFARAAAPAVGSVAENQSFAIRSGTGFNSASLNEYQGGILILMMMTPWCPSCQSNSQAVGGGLLDFFDDPARGALTGKNDKGVPIRSLLLSTEEAASWDNVNQSFATTNGFHQWGLDADAQRRSARTLLGYFRGGFINSSNLYDWGDDRRRIVVLNLVDGSSSHSYREIILNQNSYSSGDNMAARAAINSIAPEATATGPEVALKQGKVFLESRESTVAFGKAKVRGSGRSLSFRITNTGNADLNGLSAAMAGNHAREFLISPPRTASLAPGKSTSFDVTFLPRKTGPRKATLRLNSSDPGGIPFVVRLSGRGTR